MTLKRVYYCLKANDIWNKKLTDIVLNKVINQMLYKVNYF